MSIADNIKRLREEYGLNQAELGKIAGVSDKAVSTWENGIKTPRMGAVQKLSDYFGIPKSVILDDAPNLAESPTAESVSPEELSMIRKIREAPEMRDAIHFLIFKGYDQSYIFQFTRAEVEAIAEQFGVTPIALMEGIEEPWQKKTMEGGPKAEQYTQLAEFWRALTPEQRWAGYETIRASLDRIEK